MSRRRHLIAYDIADPKRLRRVIGIMESFGTRLQYSVFLCDLTTSEFLSWKSQMMDVLVLAEDSVVTIDMGELGRSTPVSVIGKPRSFPPSPGLVL